VLPAICVQARGCLLRNATISLLRFRMPVLLPAAVESYVHAALAASAKDTVRRMTAVESVEAFRLCSGMCAGRAVWARIVIGFGAGIITADLIDVLSLQRQ